jgi:uncharacterized SAM-binding protein YcdF (DUF218 family)
MLHEVASMMTFRRVGKMLFCFAVVAFWIAATPVFANWLSWRLESMFPPVSVEMLPQSDVIIVLGGVGGEPIRGAQLPPRLMHALRIYNAGKAPLIVISAADAPEAQLNTDRLVEFGAPRSALIQETASRNTRENAVNVAAIFKQHGWRTGLLVTSAAHMPRALAAFQNVGLTLIPAATDAHASPNRSLRFVRLRDLVPDAGAFNSTESAIREMIGLCVYRFRGWA